MSDLVGDPKDWLFSCVMSSNGDRVVADESRQNEVLL